MSDDPVDDIPLPSNPILSEAESEAQIHADQHRKRLAGAAAKSEQSDTPARQLGEPIWCAACGKMGDHGSGSCPTISHDYAELLPMMNAARMRMESALAAAKAEQSESTARIAGLQARVDQYQQERSDAIDQLAELRDENAELRKRPTMEEYLAWTDSLAGRTASAWVDDPNIGLAAFLEQRRKEG